MYKPWIPNEGINILIKKKNLMFKPAIKAKLNKIKLLSKIS